MTRMLIGIPLLAVLGFFALGCEPLSEEDRAAKDEATAILSAIGERLPGLKEKLERLIDRGKSIAVEVAEIRAKVKEGSFPAGAALELVAGLMAEKDTIEGEILDVKLDIEELVALGKKANDTLEELRKRNKWAWARTIGEGALALILAYFGVNSRKRGVQVAGFRSSLEIADRERIVVEDTRDVLIRTIENHPTAKKTARAKAEEAGVLAELGRAVDRIT